MSDPRTTLVPTEQIASALKLDTVVAASQLAPHIQDFDSETMNDDDEVALIDSLAIIGRGLKQVEADQREILRPFDFGIKQIRDKFRGPLDALKRAMDTGKTKLTRYRMLKEQRVRDEQRRLQLEAEAAARSATVEAGMIVPPAEEVAPARPANKAVGAIGSATGRKTLRVWVARGDVPKAAAAFPHLFELNESSARLEVRAALDRDQGVELRSAGVQWEWQTTISIGSR